MLATVPNQITVYDLHRSSAQRQQKQRESFEHILQNCYSRIRRLNRMRQTRCTFIVPVLLFGRPLYDANACIAFMSRNLMGNGFSVECPAESPRVLHISWDLMRARSSSASHTPSAAVSAAAAARAAAARAAAAIDPIWGSSSRQSPSSSTHDPTGSGRGRGRGRGKGRGGYAQIPDFPVAISPDGGRDDFVRDPADDAAAYEYGGRMRGCSTTPEDVAVIPTTDGIYPVPRAPPAYHRPRPSARSRECESARETARETATETETETRPVRPSSSSPSPGIGNATLFERSISQFKPSGKFRLQL